VPKRFSVDVSLLLREEEFFDCVQKASMILGKRVGAMFTGDGERRRLQCPTQSLRQRRALHPFVIENCADCLSWIGFQFTFLEE